MKAGSRRIFKVSTFTEAKDTENPFSSEKAHIHVLLAFWKDSLFSLLCLHTVPDLPAGARCVPSCNTDGNS